MNSLTAILGEISAEQDATKEKRSNKRKLAEAEKEKQKAKAQVADLAKNVWKIFSRFLRTRINRPRDFRNLLNIFGSLKLPLLSAE